MKLSYRKLKIADAEKIRIWRNNQIKILRQNKSINKKNQLNYFKKNILSKKNLKINLLGILKEKKLIGYGGLVNISKEYKTAEVSFIVDDKINHNSKLYEIIFSKFLKYIQDYSFKKKKFRRLFTETYSFRKKHIQLLEKSGFILEGVMKKHVIKKNKIYDSLIHARINKNLIK